MDSLCDRNVLYCSFFLYFLDFGINQVHILLKYFKPIKQFVAAEKFHIVLW